MKQHFLYTEGGGFNPVRIANPESVEFLIIDLFCGAGGTSTGFHRAFIGGEQVALVMACINHDPIAIKSHWRNYPDVVHFEEDIRTVELKPIVDLVEKYRIIYPNAKIILWASLECTNFSKAKGGQPRDADSRTLADHLDRYVEAIRPDYIQIENVVEFMSWGPLDANGKPISRKAGSDWLKWCKHIDSFGYRNEWKEMNSADFGAYTSRNRLFGCFAKPNLPIVWPKTTHAKKPGLDGMFGVQQKWKAVKDVLDFEDEGTSIFNRKKPLVDASLERIYAGLVKFVAGGKEAFLLKYNSMAANGDKKHCVRDIDKPANAIACQVRTNLCFISKYFSGKPDGKVIPVTGPAGAIKCTDGQSLINCQPFIMNTNFKNVGSSIEDPIHVLTASRHHPYILNPCFLTKYYKTGEGIVSVEDTAPTFGTKDTCALINPRFISREYKTPTHSSVNEPLGALPTVPKANLVNCKSFILNPSHGGHCTATNVPCVTIVARQDKAPLYLILYKLNNRIEIPIYEGDSTVMIKIKRFMALYGLSDIKMRMLKVSELILIQGFPKDYILEGNQTDQKKFIGNSVVPHVVTSWCEAMAMKNRERRMAA